jgi:hypothetical protein
MKLLGLLVVFYCVPAVAAPELSDRIRVEKVHGPQDLRVIRAAGNKEEIVGTGDMLYVGDQVITAPGQVVMLSAFDKSSWAVAPGSRLKLESRKPDAKSLFFWTFNLSSGAMWGEVPKAENAKEGFRLKVKTKFAAMGIRGTEYLLGGDEKLSTLEVLEGTVWWGKSADFAEGSYKEVKAGQHAEMGSDGKITVHSSSGDKAELAKRYGVVPGAASGAPEAKKHSTLEECTAKGKGWKSGDGSRLGECFEKGE